MVVYVSASQSTLPCALDAAGGRFICLPAAVGTVGRLCFAIQRPP
jgi:hypothetical protein